MSTKSSEYQRPGSFIDLVPNHSETIFSNFLSSVTSDFNISSALRWAIQDQWSSGLIKWLQLFNNTVDHFKDVFLLQISRPHVAVTKVCNRLIAAYTGNKLQHYATAYKNHRSAGGKWGLFIFYKFFRTFSANTLQPVQKSLLTEQQHALSLAGKQRLI